MTATATAILNAARAEIGGGKENPYGSNRTKYGDWYGWTGVAWCGMFLSYVADKVGALDIILGKHAYCPYWVRDFAAAGRLHDWQSTPRRGDIVFYDFSGRHSLAQHVGVVESYDAVNHAVVSLEGNTSSGSAGSQDDGGGVYRRRRNTLYVVGYGRPAYAAEKPADIPVDGELGPLTIGRLQEYLNAHGAKPKLAVDRDLGPKTWLAVDVWLGVPAPNGVPGRDTVRALQRKVNSSADGILGRDTVKALQRFLNAAD